MSQPLHPSTGEHRPPTATIIPTNGRDSDLQHISHINRVKKDSCEPALDGINSKHTVADVLWQAETWEGQHHHARCTSPNSGTLSPCDIFNTHMREQAAFQALSNCPPPQQQAVVPQQDPLTPSGGNDRHLSANPLPFSALSPAVHDCEVAAGTPLASGGPMRVPHLNLARLHTHPPASQTVPSICTAPQLASNSNLISAPPLPINMSHTASSMAAQEGALVRGTSPGSSMQLNGTQASSSKLDRPRQSPHTAASLSQLSNGNEPITVQNITPAEMDSGQSSQAASALQLPDGNGPTTARNIRVELDSFRGSARCKPDAAKCVSFKVEAGNANLPIHQHMLSVTSSSSPPTELDYGDKSFSRQDSRRRALKLDGSDCRVDEGTQPHLRVPQQLVFQQHAVKYIPYQRQLSYRQNYHNARQKLRSWARQITRHDDFQFLVLLLIFANCVILAMYQPAKPIHTGFNKVLDTAGMVFNAIFTVEMLLRILASQSMKQYLQSSWNVFDLLMVFTGYSSLIPPHSMKAQGLKALRALRALAPLRTITHFHAFRAIIVCFFEAIPMLISVALLLVFAIFIVAVIGVTLFKDTFHNSCYSTTRGFEHSRAYDHIVAGCGYRKCPAGYKCQEVANLPTSGFGGFDNVAVGMLTVFSCITLSGWSQIAYRIMDGYGPQSVIYFVVVTLFGGCVLLNMFLAVLKTKFGTAQSLVFQQSADNAAHSHHTRSQRGLVAVLRAADETFREWTAHKKATSLKRQHLLRLELQLLQSRRSGHSAHQLPQLTCQDSNTDDQADQQVSLSAGQANDTVGNTSNASKTIRSRVKALTLSLGVAGRKVWFDTCVALFPCNPATRLQRCAAEDSSRDTGDSGLQAGPSPVSQTDEVFPPPDVIRKQSAVNLPLRLGCTPTLQHGNATVAATTGTSYPSSVMMLQQGFRHVFVPSHPAARQLYAVRSGERALRRDLSVCRVDQHGQEAGPPAPYVVHCQTSVPGGEEAVTRQVDKTWSMPAVFGEGFFTKIFDAPTVQEECMGVPDATHVELLSNISTSSAAAPAVMGATHVEQISNTCTSSTATPASMIADITSIVRETFTPMPLQRHSASGVAEQEHAASPDWFAASHTSILDAANTPSMDITPVSIFSAPHRRFLGKEEPGLATGVNLRGDEAHGQPVAEALSDDAAARAHVASTARSLSAVAEMASREVSANQLSQSIVDSDSICRRSNAGANAVSFVFTRPLLIPGISRQDLAGQAADGALVAASPPQSHDDFSALTPKDLSFQQLVKHHVHAESFLGINPLTIQEMDLVLTQHPWWTAYPQMLAYRVRYLVMQPAYDNFFLVCTLINMGMLAMEYDGISPELEAALSRGNEWLTWMFCVEISLKLYGLGILEYFSDKFNIFDLVVVCVSIFEIYMSTGGGVLALRSVRSLRVLKSLRVLRMFKLFRYLRSLRKIGAVLISSLSSFLAIAMLTALFLIVVSVVGQHIYGSFQLKPLALDFSSFFQSLIINFQVLTLENWDEYMFVVTKAAGISAIPYFITWVVLGKYILLALFLAVMMQAFESQFEPTDVVIASSGLTKAALKRRRQARRINLAVQTELDCGSKAGSRPSFGEDAAESNKNSRTSSRAVHPKDTKQHSVAENTVDAGSGGGYDVGDRYSVVTGMHEGCLGHNYMTTDIVARGFPQSLFYEGGWLAECAEPGPACAGTRAHMRAVRADTHRPVAESGDEKQLVACGSVVQGALTRVSLTEHVKSKKTARTSGTQAVTAWLQQMDNLPAVQNPSRRISMPTRMSAHLSVMDLGFIRKPTSIASNRVTSDRGSLSCDVDDLELPYPGILPGKLQMGMIRDGWDQKSAFSTSGSCVLPHFRGNLAGRPKSRLCFGTSVTAEAGGLPDLEDLLAYYHSTHDDLSDLSSDFAADLSAIDEDLRSITERTESVIIMNEQPAEMGFTPLRQTCLNIVTHPVFEWFMSFIMLVSCAGMAFESYDDEHSKMHAILYLVDVLCTGLFMLEMILSVTAHTFKKYIMMRSNQLEAVILAVSIVVIFVEVANIQALKALRILRTVRALRALNRSTAMQLVLRSITSATAAVSNVFFVCTLFFFMFAILGVQLFAGKFHSCTDTTVANKSQCTGYYMDRQGGRYPRRWINQTYNFDNLLDALLSLFIVASLDGYTGIMMAGMASRSQKEDQPRKMTNPTAFFFFMGFITVCAFILLNMAAGVVYFQFMRVRQSNEHGALHLTRLQQQWATVARNVFKTHPLPVPPQPSNQLQKALARIVQHNMFEVFIFLAIMGNVLLMATSHYGEHRALTSLKEKLEYVFSAIFVMEALIKITAFGFPFYWSSPWNRFDLILACLAVLDIMVMALSKGVFPLLRTFRVQKLLRLLRISRAVKLAKPLKGLHMLMYTMQSYMPSFLNIGSLLLLVLFIYAYSGVIIFGKVKLTGDLNNHVNFKDFAHAMFTLYRVVTSDEWAGIMSACAVQPPLCSKQLKNCGAHPALTFIYFTSFIGISNIILLNLFTAIMIETFERQQEQEDWEISPAVFDNFVQLWSKYDDGLHTLTPQMFRTLLWDLPPPLGCHCSLTGAAMVTFTKGLDLTLVHDRVGFHQALYALVRRASTFLAPDNVQAVMDKIALRRLKRGKRRDGVQFSTFEAAMRLQGIWRIHSRQKLLTLKGRRRKRERSTVPPSFEEVLGVLTSETATWKDRMGRAQTWRWDLHAARQTFKNLCSTSSPTDPQLSKQPMG